MSKINSLEEQMRRQTLQQERMPDGSSLSEAKAGLILVLVIGIYAAIFFGIMSWVTSKADSDDYSHSSAVVQGSDVSNNNGKAAKTESDNVIDGITKDEDHIGALDEKATIIDSVKFNNLRVGETYRVSGVLKDKETGKDILDKNGKAIVAEKTFVATTPDGIVDLVYSLDSTLLAGKTVVAFEEICR